MLTSGICAASEIREDDGVFDHALVELFMRELRLSEEEVIAQVLAQSRATKLYQQILPELETPSFGGAWYDAQSRGLALATTSAAEEQRWRTRGIQVRRVARSLVELRQTQQRILRSAISEHWHQHLAFTTVDVHRNEVVVTPSLAGEMRVSTALAAFLQAGVSVAPEAFPKPIPLSAVHGGDGYGIVDLGQPCSVGFSVHGGFLTAGHCGRQNWAAATPNFAALMGIFSRSTMPAAIETDHETGQLRTVPLEDHARITTASPFYSTNHVAPNLLNQYMVIGAATPLVGAYVCRFGQTTLGPHCGVVQSLDAATVYAILPPVGHPHPLATVDVVNLIQTTACALPGDSGGPLVQPTWHAIVPGQSWAVGLLSGGSQNQVCPAGSTMSSKGVVTFYAKIHPALHANGATLRTVNNP